MNLPGIDLKILQSADGYRYSLDPFLLAAFTRLPKGAHVADLGTGSGVIALLLARSGDAGRVVGLEIRAEQVERARQNVALNGLRERVEILQGDVRDISAVLPPGGFDVVVSNPPYRPATAGRVSRGDERAQARHELAGGLADFVRAAGLLLAPRGRFFVVHLAERLAELLAEMRCQRVEPKRLRMVHSRQGDGARLVLVEGLKNGRPGLEIEAPLIVYRGAGRAYTDEVMAIYEQFGVGQG